MAVVLSNEEDSYFMSTSLKRSSSKTRLADLSNSFHQPYRAFSDSDNSSAPSSPSTAHIESADASYTSIASSRFSIASDYETVPAMDDSPEGPFSLPPSFATEKQLHLNSQLQIDGALEAPSSPRAGHSGTTSPTERDSSNATSTPESPDFSEKAEDDTAVVSRPSRQVDYLSYDWEEEDIWSSWRYITSKRGEFPNSARLENASWRTWIKAKYHLGTVSPETLNWLKDCDVTWLYEPSSSTLSKSDSLANLKKKPILKKRSMSEIMLQRSLSSASLLKQATAAVHAQESTKVLRPSLARSNTDYTTLSFSPRRGSQESSTWAASTDSSSITSPSAERKHIHFNEQVEQCIAVDVKGDDDDDFTFDPCGDDSDSDGGVMMKKLVSKRRPAPKRRSKKVSTAEGKIIAMLPSTTLKYQKEAQELQDSAMKHTSEIRKEIAEQ
ncbi:Uncharacterized protein ESCO_002352 [Escovopsis weberi]|uniref:Nitrogen regulatory protein areA GATA-like domain-containing protein n=1 Tax=Escovopsis weberi TaxID=150374 RepID=A0A0M8MZJ4_ESCWE|nr:Uncharacterized protein ESCO_002352 [Escovopsis weberi]